MPIVTNGLVGYWNSKQGVVGAVWQNIAPATVGTMNGTIAGALVQADGMYFDGVDDGVTFNTSLGLTGDYTIETWVKASDLPTANGALVMGDTLSAALQYRGSTSRFRGNLNLAGDTLNTYAKSILHHVIIRYNVNADSNDFYINGVFDVTRTDASSPTVKSTWNYSNWAIGRSPLNTTYMFKGHIPVVRFYNRILTSAEITQNYTVSTEVGLTATTPTTPVVTQLNASKTKISDEAGVNQSIITVRFDVAVTQYVARLNGVDYNTGTLVHTGGAVAANTDATIIVDWNELTTEGSNRINVYGQNANGWTVQ